MVYSKTLDKILDILKINKKGVLTSDFTRKYSIDYNSTKITLKILEKYKIIKYDEHKWFLK